MISTHNHGYKQNPLDIKQLDEFDAAISQFTQSEQMSQRIYYLRDAAAQLRAGKLPPIFPKWLLITCAIIPLFWGFFILFWYINHKAKSMMETQLENALDYWGIHEIEIDQYVSDDF